MRYAHVFICAASVAFLGCGANDPPSVATEETAAATQRAEPAPDRSRESPLAASEPVESDESPTPEAEPAPPPAPIAPIADSVAQMTWPAALTEDECRIRRDLGTNTLAAIAERSPGCSADDECVEVAVTTQTGQRCPYAVHVTDQRRMVTESDAYAALLRRIQRHGCVLPRSAMCREPRTAVCRDGRCDLGS